MVPKHHQTEDEIIVSQKSQEFLWLHFGEQRDPDTQQEDNTAARLRALLQVKPLYVIMQ